MSPINPVQVASAVNTPDLSDGVASCRAAFNTLQTLPSADSWQSLLTEARVETEGGASPVVH